MVALPFLAEAKKRAREEVEGLAKIFKEFKVRKNARIVSILPFVIYFLHIELMTLNHYPC